MYDTPENQSFDPTPPPAPAPPPRPQQRAIRYPRYEVRLTYVLMGINIFIFVALQAWAILGTATYGELLSIGWKQNFLVANGQYWRLFTAMFLHGGIAHLAVNMYSLWILGREVETIYGTPRFLIVYIIGGLLGSVASFLLTDAPSVGASGAIFALVGGLAAFFIKNRKLLGDRARDSIQNIVVIVLINLFIGTAGSIDNWAHMGGLLGGFFVAWLISPLFTIDRTELGLINIRDVGYTIPRVAAGAIIGLVVTVALALYGSSQYLLSG